MPLLRSSLVYTRPFVSYFPRSSFIAVTCNPIKQNIRSVMSRSKAAGENPTFAEAITTDHDELKYYHKKITSPGADEDTQERYKNAFTWELARHSIGEELVIYPMFEKFLGAKGKEMADKDREQHAEVKELLKKWQNLKPQDPEFMFTLEKLWGPLTEHMKEEENDDLPTLERAIGDHDECVHLGKSFNRTKMFVPTRSHPSAPDKPPFETVAALLAAPMDKISDLFRKFPKDT